MRATTGPHRASCRVSPRPPWCLRLLPVPVSRFHPTGPVGIALSTGFAAGLCSGDRFLTEEDLLRSGVPATTAWDAAAAGALDSARTGDGFRVYIRNRTVPRYPDDVLQVAVPGAAATDWLAHPDTFTTIDAHLSTVLGRRPVWFAPRVGELYAGTRVDDDLLAWVETRFRGAGLDAICPDPVRWVGGFPVADTAPGPVDR